MILYDLILYDLIGSPASAQVLGLLFNIPLLGVSNVLCVGVSHLMSVFNSDEEEEEAKAMPSIY